MNQSPTARTAATSSPSASSFLIAGSDGLHHQAGVGSAEAEAVVQHRLHLTLLGDLGHEIDARRPLAGIVEIEGRRNDLVPQRQDAEDCLYGPGPAEQV